jgi:hypothetical protein
MTWAVAADLVLAIAALITLVQLSAKYGLR